MSAIDAVMRFIRTYVYKMGFRPKWPSIFFSPSMDLILQGAEWAKAIEEGFAEGFRRGAISLIDETTDPPLVRPVKGMSLYEQMTYCPACSSKLEALVVDIKECPLGCGRALPSDNAKGLPVITFELNDGGRE